MAMSESFMFMQHAIECDKNQQIEGLSAAMRMDILTDTVLHQRAWHYKSIV
jgi:hypothetical protein